MFGHIDSIRRSSDVREVRGDAMLQVTFEIEIRQFNDVHRSKSNIFCVVLPAIKGVGWLGFIFAPVSYNGRRCRSGRASGNESVLFRSVYQSLTAVLVGATVGSAACNALVLCCAARGGGWGSPGRRALGDVVLALVNQSAGPPFTASRHLPHLSEQMVTEGDSLIFCAQISTNSRIGYALALQDPI